MLVESLYCNVWFFNLSQFLLVYLACSPGLLRTHESTWNVYSDDLREQGTEANLDHSICVSSSEYLLLAIFSHSKETSISTYFKFLMET